MASKKMLIMLLQVLMLAGLRQAAPLAEPRKIGGLFREYIGAESNGVKFTDVPINYPNVQFDFILAFASDYTADGSLSTNGHFRVFWDSNTLSPEQVLTIKQRKSNVRVALSLGGDSIGSNRVFFNPSSSVASWVTNAVSSLTAIIKQYHLDGIDIDYEHFRADPYTFAECIGELVKTLKNEGVISFASIAPFNDDLAQKNYLALWNKYSRFIDYVDFQFYTYNSGTTIAQFLGYFEEQSANYHGGRVLASFGTGSSSGGLSPRNGFFDACQKLKEQGKLNGIVAWSADESVKNGFRYETIAQQLLAE